MFNFYALIINTLSLFILMVILKAAGIYKWSANTILFTAEGNRNKLLCHTILLCGSCLFLFNYFSLIIFIAPIMYEISNEVKAGEAHRVPSAFCTVFVIEILINLKYTGTNNILLNIVLEFIITSILILLLLRKVLKNGYSNSKVNNPDDYVKDWKLFNLSILIIIIILIAYLYYRSIGQLEYIYTLTGTALVLLYLLKSKLHKFK